MADFSRTSYDQAITGIVATSVISVVSARTTYGFLVKSFWLQNTGPAVLTAGSMECSPDGTNWVGYDGTTLQTLGSALMSRILIQNDSAPYWRFRALTGSSVATLNYWWNF